MFTNTLNPILFSSGIITIRWYGLFLALGVMSAVWIIVKLFKENKLKPELAMDLCTWLIVGGLIGARLGEVLFYEPAFYFSHPAEIIFINHGGLSSHGMTLGLLISFFLFIKRKKVDWKKVIDLIIIPIPLLASFIRIGNFFNSEILGKTTNLPWGVRFPLADSTNILRHPIQIYESLMSITVFIALYFIYKKKKNIPPLFIFHFFLLVYFSSRFILEFLKADYQTGYFLTMGQFLSVPFIVWSVWWFVKKIK